MAGLTVARVFLLLIEELSADHVAVHGVELGVDGGLPAKVPGL